MKNNVVVHTPTLELYKRVVQKALDNGYKWRSKKGSKDLKEECWQHYQKDTCIEEIVEASVDKRLYYRNKDFYEEDGYDIISAEEFLEDGSKESIPYIPHYSFSATDNYFTITNGYLSGTITSGNLNQSNNKFMGIIKNAFKSKEQKALDHFGLGNGNGGLNSLGQQEFVDYLFETQKELRKGFIEQIVKEYEEATKK